MELLAGTEGAGAWTLALIMARHACGEQKVLVIADVEECFYPPAASRLGVDLRRTLVIRPRHQEKALAALAQSLRSPAVGAVVGKVERLDSLHFRRLQLAAEAGGGLGILLRPRRAHVPA